MESWSREYKNLGTIGLSTYTVHTKVVKLLYWTKSREFQPYHAQGLVLVYDTTNRESFDKMVRWLDQAPNSSGKYKILIGKRDSNQERQVDFEEGKDIAERNNMEQFLEVNIRDDENVERAIRTMAEGLTRKHGDKTLMP